MKNKPLLIVPILVSFAAQAVAQQAPLPKGHWESSGHVTHTNASRAGADLYLNIDVAEDGSFKGSWGQYMCNSYPGAYGVSIFSCSGVGGGSATGKIAPGGKGVIDLARLGRTTLTWTVAGEDELAIELPKHWQDPDMAILYQARMTRDGKSKPAKATAAKQETPPSSAVLLYREFVKDEAGALQRHVGKAVELEGNRGKLLELSDGGAAIHIADGFRSPALVLTFPDLREVGAIAEGQSFRFRCTVKHFDYQYVYMENCSLLR